MSHVLSLDGLRPEPLASYTAALGVLRLVAEQSDPGAQGWWRNDRFQLQSTLDQAGLIDFFLNLYQPTPMAGPWNGGSGFYEGANDQAITQIERSDDPRFAAYRGTLATVREVLKERELQDRPSTPAPKRALLQTLRERLSEDARYYLDAVVSLEGSDITYHPLFLSGGNDGRFDFAKSFMERLTRLLLDRDPDSQSLLSSTLFGTFTSHLKRIPAGPHDPAGSGGPFASSDELIAEPVSNPWTYVLGLEGSLLTAGGLGKVPHRSVGYTSAAPEETELADVCLPLWAKPLTLGQLRQQLRKSPEHEVIRYSFVPRNGRNHFAISTGRAGSRQSRPAYVKQLEQGLKQTPARDLERTLVEEPAQAGRILEALGACSWDDGEPPKLSAAWISAADDGTSEFGCALALSGLGRGEPNSLLNLTDQLGHFAGRDLCERMLSLLRLRARRANHVSKGLTPGGYARFNAPFWSSHPVRARHLEAFFTERLDEGRIERLLRGLSLVQSAPVEPAPESAFLPYPFALAKLAFHQYRDRRPAKVEIAEAMATNKPDQAVAIATDFLRGRHPQLPSDWPKCPTLAPTMARRWAAALLLPISDPTYEQILGDLSAR